MRYTGSTTIEWPGMVSVYAVLGPHPKVTTTGAHQAGIDFGGHRGLVREIDGRAERHDAAPGSVYVTGPSPIRWLEVRDPTEALEIYPDQALAERLRGGPAEVRPSFAVHDGVVFAVAEYTRAHLGDVITLDALAATVNLSPYHFARAFRATTGMTPHAFVTEHRLMMARDRLLRGHASVPGIALSVGFSNTSHFRRLFRRRYGLTPADLRGTPAVRA